MCLIKLTDKFVLDGNQANSFLVQNKRHPSSCNSLEHETAQTTKETYGKQVHFSLKEECCNEGCSTEELSEDVEYNVRTNIRL